MSLVVRSGLRSPTAPPASNSPRRSLQASVRVMVALISACGVTLHTYGGGSGLNTVIVVNQNSTNSCDLGNYYAEARQIAPENVLRISWAGGNTSWSGSEFTNTLLNPLLSMLASRQLTNQIDYVVLSMDIPFKVFNGSTPNSTT